MRPSSTTTRSRSIIVALASTLVFSVPLAYAAPVGFPTQQIWFSKEPFFAGDTVTISTLLVNSSTATFSGTVVFLDNGVPIDERTFSLAPGRSSEVISIEWGATAGDHRIRAKLRGATLTANGVAKPAEVGEGVVEMPTLTVDIDTDGDDIGNATDPDDDNDLVSDADELAAGTDPLKKDSDGDGISDPDEIKAGTVEKPVATTTRIVNETIDRYVPAVVRDAAAPVGGVLETVRTAGADTITQLTQENRERINELRGHGAATTTPHVLGAASSTVPTTTVAARKSALSPIVETPFRYVYWGVLTLISHVFTWKVLYYAIVIVLAWWIVRGTVRVIRRRRAV